MNAVISKMISAWLDRLV